MQGLALEGWAGGKRSVYLPRDGYAPEPLVGGFLFWLLLLAGFVGFDAAGLLPKSPLRVPGVLVAVPGAVLLADLALRAAKGEVLPWYSAKAEPPNAPLPDEPPPPNRPPPDELLPRALPLLGALPLTDEPAPKRPPPDELLPRALPLPEALPLTDEPAPKRPPPEKPLPKGLLVQEALPQPTGPPLLVDGEVVFAGFM